MAQDNGYQPAGTFKLKKMEIRKYNESGGSSGDLRYLVHEFSITESIKSGYVFGSAKIYDGVGIFHDLPIVGEERLIIEYEDFLGSSRTEEFFVYSITEIESFLKNQDTVIGYRLNFVSIGKFFSHTHIVNRCIAEGFGTDRTYFPISDQVRVLFNDYYVGENPEYGTKKSITIESTDGPQKIIIPPLRPEEAMHLMSRKAFSAQSRSQTFRFFENRDGYFFLTMEYLNELFREINGENYPVYYYSSGEDDRTPEGEIRKMNNLISYKLDSHNNTLLAITNGEFSKRVGVISPETRYDTYSTYEYLDERDSYRLDTKALRTQYSEDFIRQHLSMPVTRYVFKDYAEQGEDSAYAYRPQPYYEEIYNHKPAVFQAFNRKKISAKIYGNNTIVAGSIIFLRLPRLTQDNEIDNYLSGQYIVESVNNVFMENTYTQSIDLVRAD